LLFFLGLNCPKTWSIFFDYIFLLFIAKKNIGKLKESTDAKQNNMKKLFLFE